MSWTYKPEFTFYVYKVDDKTQRIHEVWSANSLVNLQASLSVSTVGELTATFADTDGLFYKDRNAQPRYMDIVQLCLKNRFGRWGIAWTGYLDRFHVLNSPGRFRHVEMRATTPAKKFEVTGQTAGDVLSLAQAAFYGVKGSAILKFASSACKYPGPLAGLPGASGFQYPTTPDGTFLVIDSLADSGIHNWDGVVQAMYTNPDQQKWSAIIDSVRADSGLEWYFDAMGRLRWRRPGFLLSGTPRLLLPDDYIEHDLGEGDENVVTRVGVRWGLMPNLYNEAEWLAPQSMTNHMGTRNLQVYVPWLTSKAGATALAKSLGQQFSANIFGGNLVVPADPENEIGSLVEVFTLRGPHDTTVYYIDTLKYNLVWGTEWNMGLSLSYGRSPNQSFPYLDKISYPVLSEEERARGTPQIDTILSLTLVGDKDNPAKITNAFTLVQDETVPDGTALINPLAVSNGTTFILKDDQGKPIGQYTSSSATTTDKYTIVINNTQGNLEGFITISEQGQADPPTTDSSNDVPPAPGYPSGGTPPQGSGQASGEEGGMWDFPLDGYKLSTVNITQGFGPVTADLYAQSGEPPYTWKGTYYNKFHTGIDFGVPEGTIVLSANRGEVRAVGEDQQADGLNYLDFGYNVAIRVGRYTHHYAHMVRGSSGLYTGEAVFASGTLVGEVDSTGNSTGNHLHFGIYDHDANTWVDPMDFLKHT